MPADIISTIEVERPQHGEQLLQTVIMIVGLLSAPASHLYGMPAILGQQARQNRRSRPMQSSACREFLYKGTVPWRHRINWAESRLREFATRSTIYSVT